MGKYIKKRCKYCNKLLKYIFSKEKGIITVTFLCDMCRHIEEPFTCSGLYFHYGLREYDRYFTLNVNEKFYKADEVNLYVEEKKKEQKEKLLSKALTKGISNLSHEQRIIVKAEYKQIKQQKKIEGKIRLARSLQEDGYNWRKIYDTLHLGIIKQIG